VNKFIGIVEGLTTASLAAPAASQEQGKTVQYLKRSVAIKHLGKNTRKSRWPPVSPITARFLKSCL